MAKQTKKIGGFFDDFHVRKDFHLGHILTSLAMIGGLIGLYTDSRARDERFSEQIAQNQRAIMIIQESQRLDQTPERLARIEVSIERLTVTMERVLDRMDRESRRAQDEAASDAE